MPDFYGLYDSLRVEEYLELFARAYGRGKEAVDRVLEAVKLEHKKNAYVAQLSRGMRQKLCLARALINEPEVLILDEPASGLDPIAREELFSLLTALQGKVTVFISSHVLPEIWGICTEIGIIKDGVLIFSGDKSEISSGMYTVEFASGREEVVRILNNYNAEVVEISGNRAKFKFDGSIPELLRELANKVDLIEFRRDVLPDIVRWLGGEIEGDSGKGA